MNKLTFVLIVIVILLIGIIGFLSGLKFYPNLESAYDVQMWKYSCQDGCSIATKDNKGSLTNQTFICWDECNSYINSLVENATRKEKRFLHFI